MKLIEIIEQNNIVTNSILIEKIIPYKKQLNIYYSNEFIGKPMLLVVNVTNACQYVKIVDAIEFSQAINEYLEVDYIETDSNNPDFNADLFAEYEIICANSFMLDKL
jgi:hypothetical protein